MAYRPRSPYPPKLELRIRDKKLTSQAAAEGLTYTRWVLFADQATAVRPDRVVFQPYGDDDDDDDGSGKRESGRWINHANEWIRQGKPTRACIRSPRPSRKARIVIGL